MKVLVIGQGGREHALVRALSLSPSVTDVHCVPGSDGIAQEAICHKIDTKDFNRILDLIKKTDINLVVFGPEQLLAEGLSDFLRSHNIPVFGPSQSSARFETSKSFCKDFLIRHQIPTAKSYLVKSVSETLEKAREFTGPWVLKADGLAAGKGVVICQSQAELEQTARLFFESKTLGTSGETALLEEFLTGWELSYMILTNGKNYSPLPIAQDHKRLQDRNMGPNTGGMGAIAPIDIPQTLQAKIQDTIVKPILRGFESENIDYLGVLYIGLMITQQGPYVLEFNVRFGDPEAQTLLPLLNGDWGTVFSEIAAGRVPQLQWKKNMFATCVVLAAEGYPTAPVKGTPIPGDLSKQTAGSYFLHAGTQFKDQKWQTNGGRVLNAVGIGSTPTEALKHAYSLIDFGKWPGMQFRRDIGKQLEK